MEVIKLRDIRLTHTMSIEDKASRLGFLDKEVNNQIITIIASVRPNLVLCFNLVLSLLEHRAHAFRALESYRRAGGVADR